MRYINEMHDGDNVTGIYLCKQKNTAQTKNGKDYENVTLADKTGTISCKIWDPNSMGIGEFEPNDFVEVHGRISVFNGALQMSIDRARKANPETIDQSDYLPVSSRSIDSMYKELLSHISSVKTPYLRLLLDKFFVEDEDFIKAFKSHSAAKTIHHGFMGGLLQHTVAVCDLCAFYCKAYPKLDHDLLISAALCHDIGKVRELSEFPANDYTDAGQLLGHIVIGVEMIDEKISQIRGFPAAKANQLKHLILSHHGEFEFGSPKKPALIEAVALNFADNTDAKLEAFTEILDNTVSTPSHGAGWLGFNKLFDSNIRPTV
ncbi:MAG: HD domain-containing protein [Parasporobacterium sp.]|nr:HD domain-containing protein [Parasporobacterium sp.]